MRRDESRQMFSRSGVPSVPSLNWAMACLAKPNTAAARLVLLLFVLAREDYVPVAGVDVAALFVERPPFGGDVREVVAFAVAARHPFGNVGGVVGRGGPAAARRVEPEDLAAASAQDDRRRGFGRHGDGLAAGFVLQERFGERRGDQVVGDVVAPARADDPVRRGHRARR